MEGVAEDFSFVVEAALLPTESTMPTGIEVIFCTKNKYYLLYTRDLLKLLT